MLRIREWHGRIRARRGTGKNPARSIARPATPGRHVAARVDGGRPSLHSVRGRPGLPRAGRLLSRSGPALNDTDLRPLVLEGTTKIVLLVLDGLGDLPNAEQGFRTPLEAARTPHLDRIV